MTETLDNRSKTIWAISPLKSGENRVKIIPPAFTNPACITADTGVGATTEFNSQLWKGHCAAGITTAKISKRLIQVFSHKSSCVRLLLVRTSDNCQCPVDLVTQMTAPNSISQPIANSRPDCLAAFIATLHSFFNLISSISPRSVAPQQIN